MSDYLLYSFIRFASAAVRACPLGFSLALARGAGTLYYFVAGKKNIRALGNLKIAFPSMTLTDRRRIVREMHRRFAQNLVETLYAPALTEAFIRDHVRIANIGCVEEALGQGHGVIFLGSHAGSWEISNIACAMLFKKAGYAMLANPQTRTPRLDAFLNRVRESKGCHVLRVDELKKMVAHLGRNNMLGVVADHGGKDGVAVPFFGKLAMTPVGSVRLAKKLKSRIILAFMRRLSGSRHEMIFEPFDPAAGNDEEDIRNDLGRINGAFETWIRQYPEEYLWTYNRWKYSPEKRVLILSDGKAGHLKQAQALAGLVADVAGTIVCETVPVVFRNKTCRWLLPAAGRCLGVRAMTALLPRCVTVPTYQALEARAADVVISAGSSLAAVNLALARENNGRSLVIMRPGILPFSAFDLVVMPEHDAPPARKNVAVITGSLNDIGPRALAGGFGRLLERYPALKEEETFQGPRIGVLIGGDSKNYRISSGMATVLWGQIRKFLDERGGHAYVTTSRRTSSEVIAALRRDWASDPRVRLCVIASENNPEGAVSGIFHLSDVIIVSGESISMVSEAAASGKHVVVFQPQGREGTGSGHKIERFLAAMAGNNYIYLLKTDEIYDKLSWIADSGPRHPTLDARSPVIGVLKHLW